MIVLDTTVLILVASDLRIRAPARKLMIEAEPGTLFVSAISAFEIGLLAATTRTGRVVGDPDDFFASVMAQLGAQAVDVDTAIALEAARTLGLRDPADRIIVATARLADAMLVTRDRAMLALAQAGHVRAVAC